MLILVLILCRRFGWKVEATRELSEALSTYHSQVIQAGQAGMPSKPRFAAPSPIKKFSILLTAEQLAETTLR